MRPKLLKCRCPKDRLVQRSVAHSFRTLTRAQNARATNPQIASNQIRQKGDSMPHANSRTTRAVFSQSRFASSRLPVECTLLTYAHFNAALHGNERKAHATRVHDSTKSCARRRILRISTFGACVLVACAKRATNIDFCAVYVCMYVSTSTYGPSTESTYIHTYGLRSMSDVSRITYVSRVGATIDSGRCADSSSGAVRWPSF